MGYVEKSGLTNKKLRLSLVISLIYDRLSCIGEWSAPQGLGEEKNNTLPLFSIFLK